MTNRVGETLPQSTVSDDEVWTQQEPSDVRRLEVLHKTAGYREGVDHGRNQANLVQRGFDEGYPTGSELGLAVGQVLGVLEELSRFGIASDKERLSTAEKELDLSKLLEILGDDLGKQLESHAAWVPQRNSKEPLSIIKYWTAIAESLSGILPYRSGKVSSYASTV